MKLRLTSLLIVFAFALAACSLPPVKIESDEPLKVDIKMRLDVYQHAPQSGSAANSQSSAGGTVDPSVARRRRMEEIQNLKNNRLIGEARNGVLEIRTDPPGPYGDYVRRIVAEENTDRLALMEQAAIARGVDLKWIQTEQAELWRTRSFKGEWIEIADSENGWRWERKNEVAPIESLPEGPDTSPSPPAADTPDI